MCAPLSAARKRRARSFWAQGTRLERCSAIGCESPRNSPVAALNSRWLKTGGVSRPQARRQCDGRTQWLALLGMVVRMASTRGTVQSENGTPREADLAVRRPVIVEECQYPPARGPHNARVESPACTGVRAVNAIEILFPSGSWHYLAGGLLIGAGVALIFVLTGAAAA